MYLIKLAVNEINIMMKIAILIAGEPRFCGHLDTFINNLQGYSQVDWFFYLWEETQMKYSVMQVPEKWAKIPSKEWAVTTIQEKLPKHHHIVDLTIGHQSQAPDGTVAIYKQHWSLNQVDLMRQQYETVHGKYDLVIRARLDLAINSPIDLGHFKEQIDQNSKLIFMPKNSRHGSPHPINDQFAISSSDNIKIYANLINNINNNIQIHPETQLSHHIRENGLVMKEEINNGPLKDPGVPDFGRWA
jgi:hypothetical protein